MLEKDIVTSIMRYLKTVPKCFSWKEHGGMYGGPMSILWTQKVESLC